MKKIGLLILFLIFNVNPLWAEDNIIAVKEQVNKTKLEKVRKLLSRL